MGGKENQLIGDRRCSRAVHPAHYHPTGAAVANLYTTYKQF